MDMMDLVAFHAEEVEMKHVCFAIAALILLGACAERPASTAGRTPASSGLRAALSAPTADYVATPAGW